MPPLLLFFNVCIVKYKITFIVNEYFTVWIYIYFFFLYPSLFYLVLIFVILYLLHVYESMSVLFIWTQTLSRQTGNIILFLFCSSFVHCSLNIAIKLLLAFFYSSAFSFFLFIPFFSLFSSTSTSVILLLVLLFPS